MAHSLSVGVYSFQFTFHIFLGQDQLIPGTSSVAHLRSNITAAALTLSKNDLAELNSLAS
jgi:aryl-alcohol dehydrogenase-like predicted oxidoreductase